MALAGRLAKARSRVFITSSAAAAEDTTTARTRPRQSCTTGPCAEARGPERAVRQRAEEVQVAQEGEAPRILIAAAARLIS
jgi:hypothetical protein